MRRRAVWGSGKSWRKNVVAGLVLGCAGGAVLGAQTISATSDAQVEANVLKALASAPELSNQDVQSSTVYGVVTLSGTVQTETLRTRAESLVARAVGVKKVVDELTLGSPTPAVASAPEAEGASGTGPSDGQVLQSDGTYAPAEPATPYAGTPAQRNPQGTAVEGAGSTPSAGTTAPQYGQGAPTQGGYGAPGYAQPGSPAPAYGSQGQPGYGQAPYGQPQPYGNPQGYGAPQPYGNPQGYAAPQSYGQVAGGQPQGVPVTVPNGVVLQVRINRGLDSNHMQPGTPFTGTVLNDIVAGGFVAIPRGAEVSGVVVDAKKAGVLKGEGELGLQLNGVQLGGTNFPLTSALWQREGRDKSVRTVNSALGLGVLGAIVGGVAGGGAGAAVGAGVGAGVGVAGSAASPGGQVIVPPESVLSFQLAQPAALRTVSQGEMQRLAYLAGPPAGARPIVRRRAYPGYYGPGPYGYPY